MRFTETPLAGAYVIELEPVRDERGYFARVFDAEEFRAHGLDPAAVQESVSFSRRAGTLRGLHYQRDPHGECKLIRCTRGAAYDVIVDLRPGSETYCEWFAVELTDENGRMLYVPAGLAHGFQTLRDETEFHYRMSHPYAPSHAAGVRWDDPAFGIQWPDAAKRLMSARDREWPDFRRLPRSSD